MKILCWVLIFFTISINSVFAVEEGMYVAPIVKSNVSYIGVCSKAIEANVDITSQCAPSLHSVLMSNNRVTFTISMVNNSSVYISSELQTTKTGSDEVYIVDGIAPSANINFLAKGTCKLSKNAHTKSLRCDLVDQYSKAWIFHFNELVAVSSK